MLKFNSGTTVLILGTQKSLLSNLDHFIHSSNRKTLARNQLQSCGCC